MNGHSDSEQVSDNLIMSDGSVRYGDGDSHLLEQSETSDVSDASRVSIIATRLKPGQTIPASRALPEQISFRALREFFADYINWQRCTGAMAITFNIDLLNILASLIVNLYAHQNEIPSLMLSVEEWTLLNGLSVTGISASTLLCPPLALLAARMLWGAANVQQRAILDATSEGGWGPDQTYQSPSAREAASQALPASVTSTTGTVYCRQGSLLAPDEAEQLSPPISAGLVMRAVVFGVLATTLVVVMLLMGWMLWNDRTGSNRNNDLSTQGWIILASCSTVFCTAIALICGVVERRSLSPVNNAVPASRPLSIEYAQP